MVFKCTITRQLKRNIDQDKSLKEFNHVLNGLPRWDISKREPRSKDYDSTTDRHIYSYVLYFKKDGGKQDEKTINNEWASIVHKVRERAVSKKWQGTDWVVSDIEPEPIVQEEVADDVDRVNDSTFVLDSTRIVTLAELKLTKLPLVVEMLENEEKLRNMFSGIFDREPQIRTALSAIKSFIESNGKRRNHVILYGLPACAKTQILIRIREILGDGAVLRLDATSTTSAGIYKLFFTDLDGIAPPPFVFIEEIEKTAEEALRVWLGALDDRGELRKLNFREARVKHIEILCMATANDKTLFDKLMGGTEKKPGALSSRFVNQLHCQRPDRKILEMILRRSIDEFGGKIEWIEPALQLAETLDTNDPRRVLAFLGDGGDRLLTKEYQRDQIAMKDHEDSERFIKSNTVDVSGLSSLIDQLNV